MGVDSSNQLLGPGVSPGWTDDFVNVWVSYESHSFSVQGYLAHKNPPPPP